jgi:eukaryotic-like serine/threonine-protein kinase
MQLSVGQMYAGRYRVVRKLGDGAMGAVYEAENVLIRRRVAIKVLHPHMAERHAAIRRFELEAQAAGRIGSPHIVEVLDMGELDGGARFLVMELLEGVTLAQRIRAAAHEGAPLTAEEAASMVIQLLAGLEAAHAADIVHRDLKPANVFLSQSRGENDFVKILDFGVSKFAFEVDRVTPPPDGATAPAGPDPGEGDHVGAQGEDMGMTGAGSVLGTPFYMSPEQAKGARHVDQRSDLYAVGVILYECVTGRVPFEAATINELIFRIVLEAPPPLESLARDLDPAFVAIVNKAMAREPRDRFQSAGDMRDALVRWLAPDRAATGIGFDRSSNLLWAAAPRTARPRRRGERAFVLGLLATLALGGVTLFAVRPPPVSRRSPSAGPPPLAPTFAAASTPPAPAASSAAPAVAAASASAEPAGPRARVPASPSAVAGAAGARLPPRARPAGVTVPARRTVPDEL